MLFKQIEDAGVIAPQLLDIVVPIFFLPGIKIVPTLCVGMHPVALCATI